MKRQFCKHIRSLNVSTWSSIYIRFADPWHFLKVIFLRALFWRIWIWFSDMRIGDVDQRESAMFFKMTGLELYLRLLYMRIALFSSISAWDNCLVYWKYSSKSTPRHLSSWVGISSFLWSLNLNEESVFRLFVQNAIRSVFCTLRIIYFL